MSNEYIIEEGKNIKKGTLSKETEKYYDFLTKKLSKLESKASDKESFKSNYYILKGKASELKNIQKKALKIENDYNNTSDKENKLKALKEYKMLAKKSSSILKSTKKEVNKLRNTLIAGGMTAAAVAAAFVAFDGYNDYMNSFTRKLNWLMYPQSADKLPNKILGAILYNTKGPGWMVTSHSVDTELNEEVNYFPY